MKSDKREVKDQKECKFSLFRSRQGQCRRVDQSTCIIDTIICLPKHEVLRHVITVKTSNTFLKYKSEIKFASLLCFHHFFGFLFAISRVGAFILTCATLDCQKSNTKLYRKRSESTQSQPCLSLSWGTKEKRCRTTEIRDIQYRFKKRYHAR